MSKVEERNEQLIELGFTLDDSWEYKVYNHHNGTWICDFALDQYSNKEWDSFLDYFHSFNTPK